LGASQFLSVPGTPNAITTGDFNGDHFLDIAVTKSVLQDLDGLGGNNDWGGAVLLNNGTGGFLAQQNFKVGPAVPSGLTNPSRIAAGLLDGDTLPDLAISGGNNVVAVMLNTTVIGSNTFTFTQKGIATGVTSTSIAIGDLSGDASNDIAIT